MHLKKFGLILVLSVCLLAIGSDARSGRAVNLTDYLAPGQQGDFWSYVYETGDYQDWKFTVTSVSDDPQTGLRKYFYTNVGANCPDPNDPFCPLGEEPLLPIYDVNDPNYPNDPSDPNQPDIDSYLIAELGRRSIVIFGARDYFNIFPDTEAISPQPIETLIIRGEKAWYLDIHNSKKYTHDGTLLRNFLRVYVLDSSKPADPNFTSHGLPAEFRSWGQLVCYSDFVRGVGEVEHLKFGYNYTYDGGGNPITATHNPNLDENYVLDLSASIIN